MTNIYSEIPEENDQEILDYNDEDEDTLTETSTNSTDTLNEKLSTTITTEDASVFCDFCREFVYFGDLKMHRRLHKALDVMQIKLDLNLLNMKYLAKRRSKLIRLLNQLPNNEKYPAIKRIDDEYSVLYNFLICETLQEFPKSNLIKPDCDSWNFGNCKTFDLLRDTKVRYRGFVDNVWQLACAHRQEHDGLSFFNGKISRIGDIYGIVTGHNGVLAQKFVAEQFLAIFKSQFDLIDEQENQELKLEFSLKKTFGVLDQHLSSGRIDIQSYKTFSSCTVELVIYHSDESQKSNTNSNIILTTVNLGSGRVILVTNNGFSVLNNSHSSIINKSECERIENEGGRLVYLNDCPYLNGQTDITRSLGGQGNVDLKLFQSIEPQIGQLNVGQECRGVIIMNCFLANVMSDEDAVNLFNNEYPNPTNDEISSTRKDDSSATDSTNNLESIWDSCSSTNHSAITYIASQPAISTSETVARKLINAAVLLTKVDRKYATIVFSINNFVPSSDT